MTEMMKRIMSELTRDPGLGAKELWQILYPNNPSMQGRVADALIRLESMGYIDGEGKPTSTQVRQTHGNGFGRSARN